jgi:murein DD-endopeptidase MepM/ murein hydrolase activator NlpD
MKNLLIYLLSPLLLITTAMQADIDSKISSTQSSLAKKRAEEKKISQKLDRLAGDISLEGRKLNKLKKDILATQNKIKKQQKKTTIKADELKKIETLFNNLKKREASVNAQITNILSKEITISMLTHTGDADIKDKEGIYENSIDDILMDEVLDSYNDILKAKFEKTKQRYIKLNKNKKIVQSELKKIEFTLNELKSQQEKLKRLTRLQNSTVQNLKKKKKDYALKLIRLKKEREVLANTLQKLNITKKEQESTRITKSSSSDVDVRKIGSSYQKIAVAKYRGRKTIAPLKQYSVAQKFGTYTDPVYEIKIFNESVILKSPTKNAKVQNVLPGKVVYASKTPMLDHVVIVEHKNNIHTIYAHLSQIAPTIKVGRKVRQGYIVGRIDEELTFEVTQNEKHINPLEMIN